jgi:hypothetical protein
MEEKSLINFAREYIGILDVSILIELIKIEQSLAPGLLLCTSGVRMELIELSLACFLISPKNL